MARRIWVDKRVSRAEGLYYGDVKNTCANGRIAVEVPRVARAMRKYWVKAWSVV